MKKSQIEYMCFCLFVIAVCVLIITFTSRSDLKMSLVSEDLDNYLVEHVKNKQKTRAQLTNTLYTTNLTKLKGELKVLMGRKRVAEDSIVKLKTQEAAALTANNNNWLSYIKNNIRGAHTDKNNAAHAITTKRNEIAAAITTKKNEIATATAKIAKDVEEEKGDDETDTSTDISKYFIGRPCTKSSTDKKLSKIYKGTCPKSIEMNKICKDTAGSGISYTASSRTIPCPKVNDCTFLNTQTWSGAACPKNT
jgi:hypothetical protein